MSKVAERLLAFLADAPHWADLLAAVPARHVQRHDTAHPVFHGCIDWHSACHGIWALIAFQGLTGDAKHAPIVDNLLMPSGLALEAVDLIKKPAFEMPYGRAWFLRLSLEDRIVTGSTRLTSMAREVANSLVDFYCDRAPDPFSREYQNASWALINLFDYAVAEGNGEIEQFVRSAAERMARGSATIPSVKEEASWTDFMAVAPNLVELLLRTNTLSRQTAIHEFGPRLRALRPVTQPLTAHHHALNFSRAWSLFAIYESTGDEQFLELYLDHMQQTLARPSWWLGDYRTVGHWIPQFGFFALQRAMRSIPSR